MRDWQSFRGPSNYETALTDMRRRTGLTYTEITREEAERRLLAIHKAMWIKVDIAAHGTWTFGDGSRYVGWLTVSANGLPCPRG